MKASPTPSPPARGADPAAADPAAHGAVYARADETGGATNDPDGLLAERLRGDDAAAFRLLVDRRLGLVNGLARRLLGNDAEAEEVAQETFLRLWRNRRAWTPGGAKLSTWLATVALNLARDRLRRRREQPLPEHFDPADPAPSAFAALAQTQISARVAGALAQLPTRQREAIVLKHFEELSQDDAAAAMGVSVEALESLLARGRRGLKALLSADRDAMLGGRDDDQ